MMTVTTTKMIVGGRGPQRMAYTCAVSWVCSAALADLLTVLWATDRHRVSSEHNNQVLAGPAGHLVLSNTWQAFVSNPDSIS